jgi:hypothetical protein
VGAKVLAKLSLLPSQITIPTARRFVDHLSEPRPISVDTLFGDRDDKIDGAPTIS